MTIVQFAPFSSLVQPSFWHELTNLKIDVLRLSDAPIPITASYAAGRSIKDRETGADVALGCHLIVGGEAFAKDHTSIPTNATHVTGVFRNFNTIEEFKAADKNALLNQVSDEIWESIIKTRSTAQLNRFILIAFADLKKYKYFYWFAFPAFVSKPAWEITTEGWVKADNVIGSAGLQSIHKALHAQPVTSLPAFFIIRPSVTLNSYEVAPVEEYESFFAGISPDQQIVGFLDPSSQPSNPGWPLRNLLSYLHALYPLQTSRVRVLCWRDSELSGQEGSFKSLFGTLSLAVSSDPTTSATVASAESTVIVSSARPAAVGWEKNVAGKMGPRMADLAPMMDPKRLADQAVDLNLKLMRWRILPDLNLDKVASTRCLLLGAGTLGCYVARTLMGWGVRKITFVDSARVSFSNPVRQPLFRFEDCLDGGKPKAECAAERLKEIFPGVDATGHSLSIPMPGHPIPPASVEQTNRDIATLENLFDEHDAVFLLMDSRESRWLPTVLGAAKGKIVLNAALGFDSYLVMRHGSREVATGTATGAAAGSGSGTRLGCYYCNDIVAPTDSLTDRTLDQMCTVTRPGLAAIAGASVVELLVSTLQHPDGVRAPAPSPQAITAGDFGDLAAKSGSILGLVPHQLRGFLAQFRTVPITGAAYNRCTGCSETILQAYEKDGVDMMFHAFNETGYLESLTGLDKLYDEGEAALEDVDWEEEEE